MIYFYATNIYLFILLSKVLSKDLIMLMWMSFALWFTYELTKYLIIEWLQQHLLGVNSGLSSRQLLFRGMLGCIRIEVATASTLSFSSTSSSASVSASASSSSSSAASSSSASSSSSSSSTARTVNNTDRQEEICTRVHHILESGTPFILQLSSFKHALQWLPYCCPFTTLVFLILFCLFLSLPFYHFIFLSLSIYLSFFLACYPCPNSLSLPPSLPPRFYPRFITECWGW